MRELEILKKPLFWLFLFLVLVWSAVFSLPDQHLHLTFCDVGQGDATLISYQNEQILIDGGPDNQVLGCLSQKMPFWDRTIEMIVLTHPEDDHFGGLIDVIKRYNVKQFVINSVINDKPSFWDFYQTVLEEKAPIYSPKAGDKMESGPIHLSVLWPEEKLGSKEVWLGNTFFAHECFLEDESRLSSGEKHKFAQNGCLAKPSVLGTAVDSGELNETSIVLKLSFGHFCAFLTGDLPGKNEDQLETVGPCQVLKVAHHGSKFSTSEDFLKKIKPDLAVISVGKNNFGHPAWETLKRLGDLGIKVLRTDEKGEIEIISDGGKWWLKAR